MKKPNLKDNYNKKKLNSLMNKLIMILQKEKKTNIKNNVKKWQTNLKNYSNKQQLKLKD